MNGLLDLLLLKKTIIDFLPNGEVIKEKQLKQPPSLFQKNNGLIIHIYARVKTAKIATSYMLYVNYYLPTQIN